MPAIPGNGSIRRLRRIEPVLTSTWRRVEALAPREMLDDDEQDEWEEEDEVEYVTLEFGSHLPEDVLNRYGVLQLLGAESAHPIARVGHKHFQGTHETLIGNDLFFSYQPDGTPAYVPWAKSSHRITFQPVRITRKPETAEGDAPQQAAAGPEGGAESDGEPSGTGSGRGRGRGRGRGKKAANPPALGPDGQPIKRKPGRPKGSKNKNPRKSIPLGPPPQVDDNDDLYADMALPIPPQPTADEALPMAIDSAAEVEDGNDAAS